MSNILYEVCSVFCGKYSGAAPRTELLCDVLQIPEKEIGALKTQPDTTPW